MAFNLTLTPKHLSTGEWEISFYAATANTYTLNNCVLLTIGEFSVGANSDIDESFSMPPAVDVEFQIRDLSESNLNLVHNVFTTYPVEVTIEKDGVSYFEGIVDANSVESDSYNYSIACQVVWASTKVKTLDSKTNPMSFNLGATAPQTNNYFIWYYYLKMFAIQNLSTHYDTLEVDENIIGRYFNGEEENWSTIAGYDNSVVRSYLVTVNPFWFTTGYDNVAPAQLGDTLKMLAKHFGLIFTVGLGDKYYLQSRWKITKTPVAISREETIEQYTRTVQAKEGLVLRYWTWNGSDWILANTYISGNVTYNSDGSIANSSEVETINIYNIFGGGNYVSGYPTDIRYNANYIIEDFSVDGGSAFGNLADVLEEPIWSNIGENRRNPVVTVNGIDWDFMDYYTLYREQNNYTYRVRQMKINVEKNQTELDLIQIF